ncbi:MAG: hypothetical protein C4294_18455 [Nitrospiraceae bacterium]
MNIDEKVKFAQEIAEKLHGVKRNEWERWASYMQSSRNLSRALQLAQYMGRSPAVRQEPQRAAQHISQVIAEYRQKLQALPLEDVIEIFGYVGRWLVAYRR